MSSSAFGQNSPTLQLGLPAIAESLVLIQAWRCSFYRKNRVTPSVAAPSDNYPIDATAGAPSAFSNEWTSRFWVCSESCRYGEVDCSRDAVQQQWMIDWNLAWPVDISHITMHPMCRSTLQSMFSLVLADGKLVMILSSLVFAATLFAFWNIAIFSAGH